MQLALPVVMAPPLRLTVLAVKPGVPLQPVPLSADTAVTLSPPAKVSVKASPLCVGLPLPLVTVKVSVLLCPTPMVVAL